MKLPETHPIALVTAPFIIGSILLKLSGYGFVEIFSPFRSTGGPFSEWAWAQKLSSPPDTSWHPPRSTEINDLSTVINGSGVHGFVFSSSQNPPGTPYGTYNWCNMPHVRPQEYVTAPEEYALRYVEVIHRHHKRTPYHANLFPQNEAHWTCDDTRMYRYGAAVAGNDHHSVPTYWRVQDSSDNPFSRLPSLGNCEFPQLTKGGIDDSWMHGRDLYLVYHDLLRLIPDGDLQRVAEAVQFRVTNNVITSQVASMVLSGFFGDMAAESFVLHVERPAVDALEPSFPCPRADELYGAFGVGSREPRWSEHLHASRNLFDSLDGISRIRSDNAGWHQSWDHYFDNLSARLCHSFSLPCQDSSCVNQNEADEVFRLGLYEYSYLYRDAPQTLEASTAAFGVWPAQLANHLRAARAGRDGIVYRHNVGHDGSIAKLLSILQVEQMVWPGMGAEIVFELFQKVEDDPKDSTWFVRVLWGGQVLRSSSPQLGVVDMLSIETFLAYIDGLVGVNAHAVKDLCES